MVNTKNYIILLFIKDVIKNAHLHLQEKSLFSLSLTLGKGPLDQIDIWFQISEGSNFHLWLMI